MAEHPLRPATRRRLGRPLPHQLADRPRAHPGAPELSPSGHVALRAYPVLASLSRGYPSHRGRLLTCYSPVRRYPDGNRLALFPAGTARLACFRHAASVRPEPGSNSPLISTLSRELTLTCCPRFADSLPAAIRLLRCPVFATAVILTHLPRRCQGPAYSAHKKTPGNFHRPGTQETLLSLHPTALHASRRG